MLGTIVSFDDSTGSLAIDSPTAGTLTFLVTEDTEIEVDDADEEGTTADLTAGTLVAEIEIDDETGTLEEIEIYLA